MAVDTDTLLALYRKLVVTREAEQVWAEMLERKEFYLMGHFGTGQEAIGVGIGHALAATDYLLPTHRGLAEYVGKGMTQDRIWAEYYTKPAGPARGKGGLHLSDYSMGLIGLVGSLGADYAIAVGAALSAKLRGTGQVTALCFGEGTSSQADFGSALNAAALWELPLVFAMTNNEWCELSHYSGHVCTADVAPRAEGYGIPWTIADGNDVVTVYETTRRAVDAVRTGGGPWFLEFKTYRTGPHWSGDDGSYMCEEDVCRWQERDPIVLCEQHLSAAGAATADDLARIKDEVRAEVAAAIAAAQALPDATYDEMLAGVFSAPTAETAAAGAPATGEGR